MPKFLISNTNYPITYSHTLHHIISNTYYPITLTPHIPETNNRKCFVPNEQLFLKHFNDHEKKEIGQNIDSFSNISLFVFTCKIINDLSVFDII